MWFGRCSSSSFQSHPTYNRQCVLFEFRLALDDGEKQIDRVRIWLWISGLGAKAYTEQRNGTSKTERAKLSSSIFCFYATLTSCCMLFADTSLFHSHSVWIHPSMDKCMPSSLPLPSINDAFSFMLGVVVAAAVYMLSNAVKFVWFFELRTDLKMLSHAFVIDTTDNQSRLWSSKSSSYFLQFAWALSTVNLIHWFSSLAFFSPHF